MSDAVFVVGQKAFITNDKGELLVLISNTIGLDLPGGKIKDGETDIREALKREVFEETQLDIEPNKVFYAWKPEKDERFETGLYLVGYTCSVKSGKLTLSHEHTGYQWLSIKDFLALKEKKGHYRAIEYYFLNERTLSSAG